MPTLQQGCQIFLGPNIPRREKYNKWPQTIPNGHKLYQMDIKYSKWSLNIPAFTIQRPSKIFPNLGFLVWKQTIWQPFDSLRSSPTGYRSWFKLFPPTPKNLIKIGCNVFTLELRFYADFHIVERQTVILQSKLYFYIKYWLYRL
jgi:hypothetical protein